MDVIYLDTGVAELSGYGRFSVDVSTLSGSGLARVVFKDGKQWGEATPFNGQRQDYDQSAAAAIRQAAINTVPRMVFEATTGEAREILTGDPVPAGYTLELTDTARQALIERGARAERDAILRESDSLMMPDRGFTQAQVDEITAYRQALRDWPASAGFPDLSTLPAAPAFTQ